MKRLRKYIKGLKEKIKEQKGVFFLFTLLRIMVIAALVRSIMLHNYDSAATCVLVLILFFVPSFLEDKLKVKLPALFETIIYCFITVSAIQSLISSQTSIVASKQLYIFVHLITLIGSFSSLYNKVVIFS